MVVRGPSSGQATGLVIFMHGSKGSGAEIEKELNFDRAAQAANLLVIYPDGASPLFSWRNGCCNASVETDDDIDFIKAIIDRVISQRLAPANHVVVAGFSSGAVMAYAVGCRLSSLVTAVVSVAGTMATPPGFVVPTQPLPKAGACAPSRPVTVYEIHGSADRTVPVAGSSCASAGPCGPGVNTWQAPVATVSQWWRRLDSCAATPLAPVAPVSGSQTSSYSCARGTNVALATVSGGLHDLSQLRQSFPIGATLVAAARGVTAAWAS